MRDLTLSGNDATVVQVEEHQAQVLSLGGCGRQAPTRQCFPDNMDAVRRLINVAIKHQEANWLGSCVE